MTQFLRDHPDVWVEMCASGGRMINLATLRMGHSHWITDYAEGDPDIGGAIRTGSNLFLPALCSHQTYFPPRDLPDDQPLPLYAMAAHFAGDFGLDSELKTLPRGRLDEIRAMVEFHRKVAHVMNGDFFLLHPQATDRADWEGWQFLSEDGTETLICARLYTASSLETVTFTPRGGVDLRQEGHWEVVENLGDAKVDLTQEPIPCRFGSERCVLLHAKKRS
jgi:alpha-galactosidase